MNILSMGQLDEIGYVKDVENHLITKIQCTVNRLFVLDVDIHSRVVSCHTLKRRHGNGMLEWGISESLKKMVSQAWVRGMPKISQVDQLCDDCLARKQRWAPFPDKAEH
jgi:hypothetical protein